MPELDDILLRYGNCRRDALLPILWDVQTAFGHISPQAVHAISHTLRVPEADIYGVIGFYSLFHSQPTGETLIRICTDPACGLAGADDLLAGLTKRLNIAPGEMTADGRYMVEHTTCLGLCEHAPAALISERGIGEKSLGTVTEDDCLLNSKERAPYEAIFSASPSVLLDRVPPARAQTLDEYGTYSALRKALGITPDDLINTIQQSGLIGRGGAAFPTATKWKLTRQSRGEPRYIICNADESETGTFKDRVLLEGCPHRLLEGLIIGAYAIGAQQGYIFVRGEYPEATRRLRIAIEEASVANLLGDNILNKGFSFHVEIRRGAGAYICGEETALFEAIEGKRGYPRVKPPYPTESGLFGKPTVVNNVETLCLVPGIIERGPDWFRLHGTEKTAGTKLVSVSGHVSRSGVYEINPGISLRQLLEEQCGGVIGKFQTALMGGASGTFITADQIDVRLTFEDLRAINSTFGSGAIMVFNDTVDLRDILRRVARFFQHESCGKCFPCQLGTQRQMEILEDVGRPGDQDRLRDIGLTMTESSLCGLGQTAGSAVLSALRNWPELFNQRDKA